MVQRGAGGCFLRKHKPSTRVAMGKRREKARRKGRGRGGGADTFPMMCPRNLSEILMIILDDGGGRGGGGGSKSKRAQTDTHVSHGKTREGRVGDYILRYFLAKTYGVNFFKEKNKMAQRSCQVGIFPCTPLRKCARTVRYRV